MENKLCRKRNVVASPRKSQKSMPPIVAAHLGRMSPSEFLALYNPNISEYIIERGYSCGSLAMNNAIPTLAHVVKQYGVAAAIVWVKIELDKIDEINDRVTSDEVRFSVARLIISRYKHLNLAVLLLFFGRYKLGMYADDLQFHPGTQRVLIALQQYEKDVHDDVLRFERTQYYERMNAERDEWRRKAISYEEYIKERDEDYSKDIVR